MDKVIIGFLGTSLDGGFGNRRWDRWRPSVALCQHDDFKPAKFFLLHTSEEKNLVSLIKHDIELVSPETEVIDVRLAINDPWDFEEVYAALHDFARSIKYSTRQYEYWVHITTGTHVAQICLFLLTEARYFPAKLVQTSPARLEKKSPLGQYAVVDLDLSRYNQLARRFAQEHAEDISFLKFGIATRNQAFNQMIEEIEQVAVRSTSPLLLTGPTGAGKSFLAKRIYELKQHKHQIKGDFIDVNCATLRGEGAMSALFGHIKGAFTGALQARGGYLRAADQGLLFLDEIGELGLDEQAMLLKAIEEHRFFPLGSDREVSSQFQLIAGTHRDLQQEVAQGRFREDLLARINMWTYRLPGLKDRREDLEPNIDFELERISSQLGKSVRFNSDAKKHYLRFAQSEQAQWRGNFRELSASLQRVAILCEDGRIDLATVNKEIQRLQLQNTSSPSAHSHYTIPIPTSSEWHALSQTLDPFELVQLAYVMNVCQQSKSMSEAGRILFARSREGKTSVNDADRLRKYLTRLGVRVNSI